MQGLREEFASVGKPIHVCLRRIRISWPMEDEIADSGHCSLGKDGPSSKAWGFSQRSYAPLSTEFCYKNLFSSDQLCVLKISVLASVCDPAKGPFFVLPSPSALLSGASLGHDLDWTFLLVGKKVVLHYLLAIKWNDLFLWAERLQVNFLLTYWRTKRPVTQTLG